MPLNNAAADSTASDIQAALAALPRGEDVSAEAMQIICRKLFAAIAANAQVSSTIPLGSIATPGDIGPPAPVVLSGTVG